MLTKTIDDVISRFLVDRDLDPNAEPERLMFHIEEAHWFYCDFHREKNPSLPRLNLKQFTREVFQRCPTLLKSGRTGSEMVDMFEDYKARIPVCGAVLLNATMDKLVLIMPWTGSGWQFPRGKIGKAESERDCAIREVREETGFDCTQYMTPTKFTITVRQHTVTMFLAVGVPEDFRFVPQTRKEVREVAWHSFASLPFNGIRRNSPESKMYQSYYSIVPYLRHVQDCVALQRQLPRPKVPMPKACAQELTTDISSPLCRTPTSDWNWGTITLQTPTSCMSKISEPEIEIARPQRKDTSADNLHIPTAPPALSNDDSPLLDFRFDAEAIRGCWR